MPFDPSAARSGAIASSNPVYQAAWVCYINGVEVPIMGFNVEYGVWKIPSFSIDLIPDISLQRLGCEDRVPVQIFYLDYWVDPAHPEFRLLVDGEIIGWRYTSAFGNRSMTFNCLAHIHIFQQLYFFYMTNVDDIVRGRAPENAAQGFGESGLLYPYSLFHQGLIVTGTQAGQARPAEHRPGRRRDEPLPGRVDTSAQDAVRPPIQAPYELIYNVVRGVISKDVPAERRAIPMMNFFARHMRKTRFHNRFVRLPFLEDPDLLQGKHGVFPIFEAARNTEALNAMQRQTASQIGNSGPVWNVLEQIYSMVYMEVAMIPNPAAVLVELDAPNVGVTPGEQRDGTILRVLTSRERIVQRDVTNNSAAVHRRAAGLAEQLRTALSDRNRQLEAARGSLDGGSPTETIQPVVALTDTTALTTLMAEAGITTPLNSPDQINVAAIAEHLRTTASQGLEPGAEGFPEEGRVLDEGTLQRTPIRLAQYFVKPQFFFGIPPHCNVIFPSMVDGWSYEEPFITQPTRLYVNDSVMSSALRATGTNRDFMLHALTVAFPEEASAVMEHKGGTHGTESESGKNLLIWPEEFYKGPVTATLALPAWFQMLQQFSNRGNQGGAPVAAPTGPSSGVRSLLPNGATQYLFNGAVNEPQGGCTFHGRRNHSHEGTDFIVPVSTDARAILPGTVEYVRANNFDAPATGKAVCIFHPTYPGQGANSRGIYVIYMHLSAIAGGLHSGAAVAAGVVIGQTGHLNGDNVFLTGGNPQERHRQLGDGPYPNTLERFGLVSAEGVRHPLVAQAQAARRRSGTGEPLSCEAILEAHFASHVFTAATVAARFPEDDLNQWPWKAYLETHNVPGSNPRRAENGWRKIARAIGGFFIDDDEVPHCHFEVIPNEGRNSLRRISQGGAQRIDPVPFLRGLGISYGENTPGQRQRRGNHRIPVANPGPTGNILTGADSSEGPETTPVAGTPATTTPAPAATVTPAGGQPPSVPLAGQTGTPPVTTTTAPRPPRLSVAERVTRVGEGGAGTAPSVESDEQLLADVNYELRRQGQPTLANTPRNRAQLMVTQNSAPVSLARLNAERVRLGRPTTTRAEREAATQSVLGRVAGGFLDALSEGLSQALDPSPTYVADRANAALSDEARTQSVNRAQRGEQIHQAAVAGTTVEGEAPVPTNSATAASEAAAARAAELPREKSFQELFRLYARYEYLKQRYTVRNSAIQMRFNPYIVPGFPSMMFDSMQTRMHTVGYIQNISHSGSAAGQGNLSTQVLQTCSRTFPEFMNDVRYDAIRFTAVAIAAPAEIVREIREHIQDVSRAERLYARLFFGANPGDPEGAPSQQISNGTWRAFRWTEAMGYARGLDTDAVELTGASVSNASEMNTYADANPSERASTVERLTISTNLEPGRELSPREEYREAFDSYDVAMQKCARPVCTLEQYIRFWHGGRTLNDLKRAQLVGPEQQHFAYASASTVDITSTATQADGRVVATRGATTRKSALYYDRIFKLRPGPGTGDNHLTPPSDIEQGFTGHVTAVNAPNPIHPTVEHAGVPSDYPQTRADWDVVLEQYRAKVYVLRNPNT